MSPAPTATRALPKGEWAHLAVSVSDERAQMYLNGERVIADQVTSSAATTIFKDAVRHTCYFGGSWSGLDYTDADFDEIKFFDRALSYEEIKYDFKSIKSFTSKI
jgi:hypothetical protein